METRPDGYVGPLDAARRAASVYAVTDDRLAGYEDGLSAVGLELAALRIEERPCNDARAARAAALTLLAECPRPTAILAMSDVFALAATTRLPSSACGSRTISRWSASTISRPQAGSTRRSPRCISRWWRRAGSPRSCCSAGARRRGRSCCRPALWYAAAPRHRRRHDPVAGAHRSAVARARLTIDKPRRCLPSSGQRPRAWHDLSARRTGQEGVTRMRYRLAAASLGLAMATALTTPALAKTLVYCSESSPEGFNPAALHCRHHLRCRSRAIYNTLVEFEHGTTNLRPGLAESWDISDDGLAIHLPSAPGGQVPDHRRLHPDPRSSMPTTWSTASSACGSRIIHTTASGRRPTSTSPALACPPC